MGTPTLDNIASGKYTNHFTYDYRQENLKRYKQYIQDNVRLMNLFRSDLEEEFGVAGHPKAELLFEKARELGNTNGLNDVYHYYADLVELIR